MKLRIITLCLVLCFSTELVSQDTLASTNRSYSILVAYSKPYYSSSNDNTILRRTNGNSGLYTSLTRKFEIGKIASYSAGLGISFLDHSHYNYNSLVKDKEERFIISTEDGYREDCRLSLLVPLDLHIKIFSLIRGRIGVTLSKDLFGQSITAKKVTTFYYYDIPLREYLPYLHPKEETQSEYKNTKVSNDIDVGFNFGIDIDITKYMSVNFGYFISTRKVSFLNFQEKYYSAGVSHDIYID